MFASLEKNIVLSEPSPVESVLRANAYNPAVTDEQRSTWLRWLLMAFGRKRTDAEKHYFIKFDSWTTLEMGLILEAFPGVPWVFLYRDPLEVLVSQMNQRSAQMIPGTIGHLLPGFGLADVMQMRPEDTARACWPPSARRPSAIRPGRGVCSLITPKCRAL